jgi:hypothetical protein
VPGIFPETSLCSITKPWCCRALKLFNFYRYFKLTFAELHDNEIEFRAVRDFVREVFGAS